MVEQYPLTLEQYPLTLKRYLPHGRRTLGLPNEKVVKIQKENKSQFFSFITSSQFSATENPLKMMKNVFNLTLKVESCKLNNNKYMIASTQITNTEIFALIAVLVFKLLSHKILFITRKKNNRNC